MNILTPNHSYPCYILQDVSGLDDGSKFEINDDEYSLNRHALSPPRQQHRPSATHSHISAMTGMLSGLSSICADDDDNLREQLQALKAKLKEKDSQIETLRADLQAALAEASAEADAVLADEEVGVEEAAAAAEEEAPPSLPLFRGDPETGCIHDGTSSTDILLMAGINVQLLSEKVGLLRCTSFSYHCIFVSYHYSSLSLILQELKFPVKGLAQPIGMTKETFESFISDPSQFIRPFKGVPTAAVDELMREGVPLIKAELQHLFNRFYANQLLGKAYSTVSDPQEAMRMVLLKLRAGYIPSLICIEDFYNHKVTEVRIRQHNPRAVVGSVPYTEDQSVRLRQYNGASHAVKWPAGIPSSHALRKGEPSRIPSLADVMTLFGSDLPSRFGIGPGVGLFEVSPTALCYPHTPNEPVTGRLVGSSDGRWFHVTTRVWQRQVVMTNITINYGEGNNLYGNIHVPYSIKKIDGGQVKPTGMKKCHRLPIIALGGGGVLDGKHAEHRGGSTLHNQMQDVMAVSPLFNQLARDSILSRDIQSKLVYTKRTGESYVVRLQMRFNYELYKCEVNCVGKTEEAARQDQVAVQVLEQVLNVFHLYMNSQVDVGASYLHDLACDLVEVVQA